jgi:hypothetical protein
MDLEFLYRGALCGEPGIFIAFEERVSALRENQVLMALALNGERHRI